MLNGWVVWSVGGYGLISIIGMAYGIKYLVKKRGIASASFFLSSGICIAVIVWIMSSISNSIMLSVSESKALSILADIHRSQVRFRNDVDRGNGDFAINLQELNHGFGENELSDNKEIMGFPPANYRYTTNKEFSAALSREKISRICEYRHHNVSGDIERIPCKNVAWYSESFITKYMPIYLFVMILFLPALLPILIFMFFEFARPDRGKPGSPVGRIKF